MGTYGFIIGISIVIILSFLFNIVARKTNVPSVLMLILLGIGIQYLEPIFGIENSLEKDPQLMGKLQIVGNVGLILIVLEAALDLELKREKIGVIFKSFMVALLGLLGSVFVIAFLIQQVFDQATFFKAMVYATPLSIMSSAIIIPSVGGLRQDKKEFMIYESTFSDILGIMLFYFLIQNADAESATGVVVGITTNILITLGVAIIASYGLVILFQNLQSQVKLFLIIAVLMLLYAIGKSFHLSALIIILMFGLILNNTDLFLRGPLKRFSNKEKLKPVFHDFHVLTLESAFVTRTFFFVMFGLTIEVGSLVDLRMAGISLAIIGCLYLVRVIFLKLFVQRDITPQLFIAPRGLITVLLFMAIPNGYIDFHGEVLENYNPHYDLEFRGFKESIVLFVILISSVIMMVSLVLNRGGKVKDMLRINIVDEDGGEQDSIIDEIEEYSVNISEHEQNDTSAKGGIEKGSSGD